MMPMLELCDDYVQRHGLGTQRRIPNARPPKPLRPCDWAGNFMMAFARQLVYARWVCGAQPLVREREDVPLLDLLRTDVMYVVIVTFINHFVFPEPKGQFKSVQEGLLQLHAEDTTRSWTCMALNAAFYGAQQADEDAAERADGLANAHQGWGGTRACS